MKSVNPYLNFAGNTEEVFKFYQTVFGGELMGPLRYKDFSDNSMDVSKEDENKIAHVGLPLGKDNVLMGTDVLGSQDQELVIGNNSYITIETDSQEETDKLFSKLSDGGRVDMKLQEVEWAESYGIVCDKFGVQWMISYTGSKQFEME